MAPEGSMTKFFYGVIGLLIGAALTAFTALCLAVTGLVYQAYVTIDAHGGLDYMEEALAERFVNLLTQEGFDRLPLDPDDPMLGLRKIVVTEGLNERVARDVVERLLHLDALDPTKPIDLYLATSGGWLDSAFMIIDTMRSIRAPVNVIATGGCYSAGTAVLAAATGERTATPGTVLSIHVNDYLPAGEFDIDEHELRRFQLLYARYTDVPQYWFTAPGDNHFYIDADQALDYGLIDEVAKPEWVEPKIERKQARPAA